MRNLPEEIKLFYIVTIIIVVLMVLFLIFVVKIYNDRQLLHNQEKQLADAEYRSQLLEREIEKQKSLREQRERISLDMHDEIGAGLSAMKLHSEMLKMHLKNNHLTEVELNSLIEMSDELIVSMREMLWALNPEYDEIQRFAEFVKSYIKNYFTKTEISPEIHLEVENPDAKINSESKKQLIYIVKEICHNIVKHSAANNVLVNIKQKDNHLYLSIQDNGVGFQNKAEGFGLKSLRHRTEQLKGEFEIKSSNPGTQINIHCPI